MKTQQTASQKKRRTKKLFIILSVLLALIVLLWLLIPVFLSSPAGTRMIENQVNARLDGTLNMQDFSIGWMRGIRVRGLDYEDASGETIVRVPSANVSPKYFHLLFGTLSLKDGQIDSPAVTLNIDRQKIDFPQADIVAPDLEAPAETEPAQAKKAISIGRMNLAVNNGAVTINLWSGQDPVQTVKFEDIHSALTVMPPGQQSSASLDMAVAGGTQPAMVTVQAQATPNKDTWRLESGRLDVKIEKLQLETLRPLFALMGRPFEANGTLDADANVKIEDGTWKQVLTDAKIKDFSMQTSVNGKASPGQPVTVKTDIKNIGSRLQIDALDIQSPFLTLGSSGTQEKLDFTANADLEQTLAFARQFGLETQIDVNGSLNSSGTLNLREDGAALRAGGTLSDFQVINQQIKTPTASATLDLTLDYDAQAKAVTINRLNAVSTGLGEITIENAKYLTAADSAIAALSGTFQTNIELAPVLQYAQAAGVKTPPDLLLEGTLDAQGFVGPDSDKEKIRAQLNSATITDLVAGKKGSDIPPLEAEKAAASGTLILDPAKKTFSGQFKAKIGEQLIEIRHGSVEKSVEDNQVHLDADLDAAYDLTALSTLAAPFIPEGLTLTGKREDKIKFSTRYAADQTPPDLTKNMQLNLPLGFDSASWMGFNLGPTQTSLSIQNGILTLTPFETAANSGTLRFGGTADLTREQIFFALNEPVRIAENVRITSELTNNLLRYMNPLFADAVSLRGVLDFSCETLNFPLVNAPMSDLKVEGKFSIADMSLQGSKSGFLGKVLGLINKTDIRNMQVVETPFTVNNEVIAYDNMQINLDQNPINFGGKINFNQQMNMSVMLPYTLSGDLVRTDQANRKDRITLPLDGTLTNPRLDTQAFLEQQGRQLIGEQIRKALGLDKKQPSPDEQDQPAEEPSEEDKRREELRKRVIEGIKGLFE